MLDIKYIREHKEEVKTNVRNRLSEANIDLLLELDDKRRQLLQQIEDLREQRNKASKTKPTPEIIAGMKQIGEEIKKKEEELAPIEKDLKEKLLQVPNLTHPDVKVSTNEDDNPILEKHGEPTKFDFSPLDHVQLAENLDLIDFERGTNVSGAKFYYLKNQAVLLEMSLARYAFDIAIKHGFTPFITPDLAKREILDLMGYNPRGASTQVYNIENTELSLIGTAEITMGGYHKDEIFKQEDLPKKYVAMSHCFRTEAGSYSKFSKGIFRVHQFTKVELFQYAMPEKSEEAPQELLAIEKEIFDGLEIPYRVIDHSTADLGAPSYRTFDLEAWMPGKPNKEGKLGDWAEITSTSNCTDYQARGLNIKYIDQDGNKNLVHMLNGTAIAMTRPIIAILENFQQADGSVKMPDVLIPYLGFSQITQK
jgi:seryl-tRNA synthetase